jgi:sialidase-1
MPPRLLDSPLSRRQFVQSALGESAAAMFANAVHPPVEAADAQAAATHVLSLDHANYHGWPTLMKRRNGQLMVVCSGGREEHVCPFGRVDLYVSNDGGQTWSWPRTILDSDLDDRDAGILETRRGALLVTSFTSLAYEPILAAAERDGRWPVERLSRWKAAQNRLSNEARKAELGQWMIRSTDGGRTWSPRYSSMVNSPHGPIELSDGRLLYAGKELWTGRNRVGVCQSRDDGVTWEWLAEIPARPGDAAADYHELHAVECSSGRIVVQIRNHNAANAGETLQTESDDGGRSWTAPHSIGVWGVPSHLLRLSDGRLLMSYGHRRAPLGNQARWSADDGRTWSEAIVISGDGASGDLGYPSTVELENGRLLTVWYELMQGNPRAVLRQAFWTIPG